MFKGLKGKFLIAVIVLAVIAIAIIVVPLLTKPAYATSTMLSILAGTDIQVLKGAEPEAEWEQAEDGMTLKEGYSVKKGKYLSELYKIKPAVLYRYSLKKLTNVQKVQFERGLKSVLGDGGVMLTRSVALVPMKIKNEMIDFLKRWNVYYESQEYELLPILRKEVFL